MKQGIVICTWSGGQEQFEVLLNSIHTHYPIFIVFNDGINIPWEYVNDLTKKGYNVVLSDVDGYEMEAIKLILEHTDLDEFTVLQDTFEIIDNSLFDRLFVDYVGRSVQYNPHFQMYLGKFRRVILEQMTLPEVRTKAQAVSQEWDFIVEYRKLEPDIVTFNSAFRDENFFGQYEDRFGRKNLVMKDKYLIKRKGTWDASQIPTDPQDNVRYSGLYHAWKKDYIIPT